MSKIFYLISGLIFQLFGGCSSSDKCDHYLFDSISNVVRTSNYSDPYKTLEIKNKKKLLDRLCNKLENQNKLLLIEKDLQGNSHFGLVYTYKNNRMYTYEQYDDMTLIAEDNRFDMYGGLEKLFSLIKDSTIQRTEKRREERKIHSDATQTRIYYIDQDKNISRLIIL